MGDGAGIGLRMLGVCGLLAVFEVGGKEGGGSVGEVEFVFEFVNEGFVEDGIVRFR